MEFLQDFQTKITRAEFEERCQDLFDKVLGPVEKVLARNNLTMSDIDQFEAIGGAWRTPRIRELIQTYIGDLNISTHLNSHEAMATGAAFHAANGSYSFRARPVILSDGLNTQVDLTIKTLNNTRNPKEPEVISEVEVNNGENEDGEENKTSTNSTEVEVEIETELVERPFRNLVKSFRPHPLRSDHLIF